MYGRSYRAIDDVGGVEVKQVKIGDSIITFSKSGIKIKNTRKEEKHGRKNCNSRQRKYKS